MEPFLHRPPRSTEEVRALLLEHDVHPTSQRLAIAVWVLNARHHPSADEVFVGVRAVLPGVSQATVYNTLNRMVERDLLHVIHENGGRVRYDPNTEPHHHFLDLTTGQLHDIAPDSVSVDLRAALGSEIDVHRIRVTVEGRQPSQENVPSVGSSTG